MFNQLEYQTVVLAALLHDVGRFLKQGTLDGIDTTGSYPQVSANFVSTFADCFSKVADVPLLKTLVQRHHEGAGWPPELRVQDITDEHTRALARLVAKADRLSSAEPGGDEAPGDLDPGQPVPLTSVFGRVSLGGAGGARGLCHHLVALGDVESLRGIFPEGFDRFRPGEVSEHLRSFENEFRRLLGNLDTASFDCVLTHLLGVLEKYTWCVASGGSDETADVSLYDHLRTASATAAALYHYEAAGGTLDGQQARPSVREFCIAVGDLSGIQEYIFKIVSTPAAGLTRRLRARSLYIQLVTEVVSHRILRDMGLPFVNAIMSSGGKFYLLLPNTAKAKSVVRDVQTQVDEWLLDTLNGELALNLATATFGEDGFSAGSGPEAGFGGVLRDATAGLSLRKRRRFAEALAHEEEWKESAFLLRGFEHGQVCESCRKFPPAVGQLCEHCELDSQVGRGLPSAQYVAFFADGGGSGGVPLLGYSVQLSSKAEFGSAPYLVLGVNGADLERLAHYPALSKYVANYIPRARLFDCEKCRASAVCADKPTHPDEPAKFDCMANSAKGRALVGFLKADVDNLGATFIYGLKRDHPERSYDAVSRLTTLSRRLDAFFSGWVQHLLSNDFTRCYTVFSGGDDLFVVGPWDDIIRLADRTRDDLARYVGNPDVTLSAGVFLGKPGFPVARAAGEVEDMVDRAKEGGRNAVALSNRTLPWDRWKLVEKQWLELEPDVKRLPTAFLYSLLRYGRMWKAYVDGNVLGLRYQPLLAHNISRNVSRRDNPAVYDWAARLLKLGEQSGEHKFVMENLELIATLLILGREGGR